jgi:hypothetical protein
MVYSYDMKYVPGKFLVTADTLSRQPLSHTGKVELKEEVAGHINYIISHIPAQDEKLSETWKAQTADPTLQEVYWYKCCLGSWPLRSSLNPDLKKFWAVKDEISCSDGLLMKGCRLVIPKSMQDEILGRLHEGHLGIVNVKRSVPSK